MQGMRKLNLTGSPAPPCPWVVRRPRLTCKHVCTGRKWRGALGIGDRGDRCMETMPSMAPCIMIDLYI
jgi:hypothetical protein